MKIHTEVMMPPNYEDSKFMLTFFYDVDESLDEGSYKVIDVVLIVDNKEYGHLTSDMLEILQEEKLSLQRESVMAASVQCPECVVE